MENFPQYRAISGISTLIKIHTKRWNHYRSASVKAKSMPLKTLFRNYAVHSQNSIKTLVRWLIAYGGTSNFLVETREPNSVWNKIGGLFHTERTGELLHKSEAIERYSLIVHRKALELYFIPPATTGDIEDQIRNCEEAFATMRKLQGKGGERILVGH